MINKYRYRIKWYDSYKDEEKISEGYVFGNTFPEAAKQVTKFYGTDTFIKIEVEWADDTSCYVHEENERISTSTDDF